MLKLLLDMIDPSRPRVIRHHVVKVLDTITEPKPVLLPDTAACDTTSCAPDSVVNVQESLTTLTGHVGNGGIPTTLLWGVFVTLLLIAFCLYFARLYRTRRIA